ncbi:MAG: hypothetical protein IJ890_05730 [Clostridia bacterium]|nr:hypothetical protein [Clostridia bacterium]
MAYYNGRILVDLQNKILDKYNIYVDIEELSELTIRFMKLGSFDLIDLINLKEEAVDLVAHNLKITG